MAETSRSHSNAERTVGGVRTVAVTSGGHHWRFAWTAGDEPIVTARIMKIARDPDSDLGWATASLLCHRIGRRTHTASSSGNP